RPTFTLVYSSDLRGRMSPRLAPLNLPPGVTLAPLAKREAWAGLGRRATIVDRARVGSGGVVQVDAGDFLPLPTDDPRDDVAPAAKDVPHWLDLVLASYRRLGVDAVTLGERELAQPGPLGADPRRLAKKLRDAHVPVVLANLVGGKGAPVFPASALVDAGGTKVGVLGVSELDAAATAALAKAGFSLAPPEPAARAAAKDLRARGAAVVVALVHASAGRARAAAIAGALDDVDVAVLALGHDAPGAPAPPPSPPNARPRLVAAGGDLVVGRLDARLEPGRAPALEDGTVELSKAVPEQLGVGLLSRTALIPMRDRDKMEAEAKKNHVQLKLRDLYEIWDYGSTSACGYCHEKVVTQWKTTDHAHAFATLVRAKRDRDPECLGCHTIGFLQPGGTRDFVMARSQFADVGCEGCHGPSAAHVRAIDKHQGTVRKVDPVTCLGCHTPDQNVGSFDPVASMKEILGPGHGAPAAAPGPAPAPKPFH
ncbi:MAG TPA: multiheme c-type cytochrome, partial [Polyangia bacterium]|nr:multiheme c-type cytochrome [Polyangia bacterium]